MKATRRNPIHDMNKMLKYLVVAAFAFSSVSCCGHHLLHHHHAYNGYNAYPSYGYHSYNHAPSHGNHGFAVHHHRR